MIYFFPSMQSECNWFTVWLSLALYLFVDVLQGFFSYHLSSCKPNDLFWDIKMFDFLRLSLKISLADDSGANCSSRRLFVSVPFLDDVVFFSTLALMNDSH